MSFLSMFLPLLSFLAISLFGNRFGNKGSIIIATSIMCFCVINSLAMFLHICILNNNYFVYFKDWMILDTIKITWEFSFTNLTVAMWVVVNTISFLVHLYSIEYMSADAHIARFMSYLSLFTFFMLILVAGNSFIVLFVGWEGVGLSSYLLISFWYTRINANKSAIKALVVNRVSDFALTLGILFIFYIFKSWTFSTITSLVPFYQEKNINFLSLNINPLILISFLLFTGAMGKSAQLLLHTWLPDAMEGPTPVSALIHAATMVTAGVFLVIKCSFLFEATPIILIWITIIGTFTAFFSATIGLVQSDIKKVIAYSTCSQLGYMFLICGASGYNIALFHLINHAFFKALLFLSAGAIIHSMSNDQDMRKYGGLLRILPFTYIMILIGSLALMGFPFTTGYYSKDLIIEFIFAKYTITGIVGYWLGLITAALTSFYSFRVIYLTFINTTNSYKPVIIKTHEVPLRMGLVLIFLSIGSIFLGYFLKDWIVGIGSKIGSNNITILNENNNFIETEFVPLWIKISPFCFSMLAVFFGFIYNNINLFNSFFFNFFFNKYFIMVHYFLTNKWYIDLIYNKIINLNLLNLSYNILFKIIDKGFLEFIGPFGLKLLINNISTYVNKTQRGLVVKYGRNIFYFMWFIILLQIIF